MAGQARICKIDKHNLDILDNSSSSSSSIDNRHKCHSSTSREHCHLFRLPTWCCRDENPEKRNVFWFSLLTPFSPSLTLTHWLSITGDGVWRFLGAVGGKEGVVNSCRSLKIAVCSSFPSRSHSLVFLQWSSVGTVEAPALRRSARHGPVCRAGCRSGAGTELYFYNKWCSHCNTVFRGIEAF